MFDLERFHREAVATASDEDVREMRSLLVDALSDEGYEPEVDAVGCVVAARSGEFDGPHLVLNTHLDTVPPHIPYDRDGDVVRGRGVVMRRGRWLRSLTRFVRRQYRVESSR